MTSTQSIRLNIRSTRTVGRSYEVGEDGGERGRFKATHAIEREARRGGECISISMANRMLK